MARAVANRKMSKMKFWKGKKKAGRFTISHQGLTIIFSLLRQNNCTSFACFSCLCFMSSIPPSAAELRRSFCTEFASVRGQENTARDTEAPHQTSQEFSSCFSSPLSSPVCFHVATKIAEVCSTQPFFPSPFPPSSCLPERSDVGKPKSQNMMSPLN